MSSTQRAEFEPPAPAAPDIYKPSIRTPLIRQAGSTLIEVLVALFILSVGLLGFAGALAVQTGGIAGGMSFGLAAINRSHMITTATMLAQAMAESVKQATFTEAEDRLVASRFPDEGYGRLPGFPMFRRTVLIEPGPEASTKQVTVMVAFRAPGPRGIGPEEQVRLSLLLARRPSP